VTPKHFPYLTLIQKLAGLFSDMPQVQAIALGGSLASGQGTQDSDIDLYVFTQSPIPLEKRQALAEQAGAGRADLGLEFWDAGDEWYDASSGIEVDVVYWDTAWISGQLERALVHHQANVGCSTCFWCTIRNCLPLFDRDGWLARLKELASRPYPEPLRLAIIAKNHAVLRRVIPSYYNQLKKAVRRGDLVSVNHRLAALLASYFDILFALNRLPNPGEKRLVQFAVSHCRILPEGVADGVESVLRAAAQADERFLGIVTLLLNDLDALLVKQGFDPATSLPSSR
jgi:hypothetical protein